MPSPPPSFLKPPSSSTPLPPTHPLAAELAALRQQVGQYRSAAHQASIAVQGVRLELELAREEATGLRAKNKALEGEVEVLRTTPDPPQATPPSNALAELSLAHRRLSAKLDFTEQKLSASTLELASTQQELQRVQKRADGDRAALTELRRVEDDREEELEWERSERKRIEEQKKLCELALAEYAALVSKLDARAIPPPLPRRRSNDILQVVPEFGDDGPPTPNEPADRDEKWLVDNKAPPPPTKELKPTPPSDYNDDSDDEDDLIAISGPEPPVKDRPKPATPPPASPVRISPAPPSPSKVTDDAKRLSTPIAPDVSKLSDSISNLLLGQRGVHRLFRDFSATLTAKETEIRELQKRAEELEGDLSAVREQLISETAQRVEAVSERDRALRDDASAAKVVERYMTFSQKAHETVHAHLGQLRTRGAATQASLRTEATNLRRRLQTEADRAARLRAAAEEMAEELGKEAAGRRREVALRLQLIATDEARSRRAEQWLDRVRRAREPEAREALSAPVLGALLDEGAQILSPVSVVPEKAPGWGRRLLARRKSVSKPDNKACGEEESMARVLLAEELVQHLVDDLQIETERRVELEKQRVEWLAKEAEDGVPPEGGQGGGLVFDADDKGDKGDKGTEDKTKGAEAKEEAKDDSTAIKEAEQEGVKADEPQAGSDTADEAVPVPSPSPTPAPPHLDELSAMFDPLVEAYSPFQKSLHDQAVSLGALRASLPDLVSVAAKKGPLRALALRPASTARDDLLSLLDGLHEVIEDARVDAEIAVADEDRVFHGFAALLGVGASGIVQASSVLRDARVYVDGRGIGVVDSSTGSEGDSEVADTQLGRLSARVGDIEHDLALIKRTLHEAEGMDAPTDDEPKEKRRKSVWALLPLRTVSAEAAKPFPPSLVPLVEDSNDDAPMRKVSLLSTVGRSFSSSVGVAATNVAGAPRNVSNLAGGLFRPRRGTVSEKKEEEREGEVE
ncbi:hypothetical protein CcaverHIS002_0106900 [Cutaneotrichosporon cavernicola]|uniref:Uncharacterized protein n=1 Tax=Cutaneotrichosporon cavernicola TaxID=279322 RepID=A0AA48KYV3_9TREE|nr:uncharacterized protein CcaverHIS019_0106840 [Cutaneotrichosporon cavernicola]BEI80161.1 hypothetical protein CcaverHIS002_0106900 [Cutaneotrichosporon cavernicola]BEI87966.1 hypothetical protein CcaverHIS019_0106840 [Cutaneotrichosporon cavernicola]BEI95740.1 hypothetical protein CcaverHIS631_0106890 [Cutaneotrichosporon cavernicola]BEJ03514.1 hypothetical protein CcaverHIS641_0106890 [Cutaneotrichosporon cavernicola]